MCMQYLSFGKTLCIHQMTRGTFVISSNVIVCACRAHACVGRWESVVFSKEKVPNTGKRMTANGPFLFYFRKVGVCQTKRRQSTGRNMTANESWWRCCYRVSSSRSSPTRPIMSIATWSGAKMPTQSCRGQSFSGSTTGMHLRWRAMVAAGLRVCYSSFISYMHVLNIQSSFAYSAVAATVFKREK